MAEQTGIEWATATWNPWQGCEKVSPGCKHCYMYREKARYGQDPRVTVRSAPPTFGLPLRTTRDGQWKVAPGSRIFTCSWSDWFIADADAWRDEAWAIVQARPDVIFMILTKRPERIADHLPPGGLPRNVWLGVSVESQRYAWRIDKLLEVEASVRFVSAEPLLGPLDLTPYLCDCYAAKASRTHTSWCPRHEEQTDGIDWVIIGGESGSDARPMDPRWASHLAGQAAAAEVAVHFKQWGEWAPIEHPSAPCHDFGFDGRGRLVRVWRVGKRSAGRVLLGRTWDEYPGALR